MKRLIGVTGVTVLAIASCHSVLIRIDRRGSAGIVDLGAPKPRTFFDAHAIPLPAHPFVNCYDVVAPRLGEDVCAQTSGSRAFRGYTRDQVAREQEGGTPPAWLRRASYSEEFAAVGEMAQCYASGGGRSAAHDWPHEERTVVRTMALLDGDQHSIRGIPATVFAARLDAMPAVLERDDDGVRVVVFHRAESTRPRLGTVARYCDSAGVCHAFLLARGTVPADGDTVRLYAELAPAEPVLSFIHISDAQIREPAATLGGQDVSDKLDPIVESFAHDYEQELYSSFVYEAFVSTINHEIRAAAGDVASADAGSQCVLNGDGMWPAVPVVLDSLRLFDSGGADDDALVPVCDERVVRYRPGPRFVVHTGDAIDMGLESEFESFLQRSDDLVIPWYSVIGNHDILGFGNLSLTPEGDEPWACTPTSRLVREYHLKRPHKNGDAGKREIEGKAGNRAFSLVPLAVSRVCLWLEVKNDRLLAMPEPDRSDDDPSLEATYQGVLAPEATTPLPIRQFILAHCRRSPAGTCVPHRVGHGESYAGDSLLNGYDLTPGEPGYYAFAVPVEAPTSTAWGDRKLWVVVLNTSTTEGAFGGIDDTQLTWLRDQLPDQGDSHPIKRRDVVLVFAHHPLWGIESLDQRNKLESALLEAGNVIALFAGHTHSPQLRVVGSMDGPRRFWEVVAPSTLAFPQQARQVTLKLVHGTDLGYLEVLSFEPHLEGFQQRYVVAAMEGAQRDRCNQSPHACANGKPRAPEQHKIFPRLFFRLPPVVDTPVPLSAVDPANRLCPRRDDARTR